MFVGAFATGVSAVAYFDGVELDLLSDNQNLVEPYVLYEHYTEFVTRKCKQYDFGSNSKLNKIACKTMQQIKLSKKNKIGNKFETHIFCALCIFSNI